MWLFYLLGRHRRSLTAIIARANGYTSFCESCSRPMVKDAEGKWRAAEPL
jgi:hypothetical protein